MSSTRFIPPTRLLLTLPFLARWSNFSSGIALRWNKSLATEERYGKSMLVDEVHLVAKNRENFWESEIFENLTVYYWHNVFRVLQPILICLLNKLNVTLSYYLNIFILFKFLNFLSYLSFKFLSYLNIFLSYLNFKFLKKLLYYLLCIVILLCRILLYCFLLRKKAWKGRSFVRFSYKCLVFT